MASEERNGEAARLGIPVSVDSCSWDGNAAEPSSERGPRLGPVSWGEGADQARE